MTDSRGQHGDNDFTDCGCSLARLRPLLGTGAWFDERRDWYEPRGEASLRGGLRIETVGAGLIV